MKGSLRIGRLAGIDVFVHWTFILLFVYLGIAFLGSGEGVGHALASLGFVASVFGCVVLHELGHALAARQVGVATRDITLLPIGGVARLERIPEDPRKELWIAIAGPLVNVVIAAVLFAGAPREGLFETAQDSPLLPGSFLHSLLRVNVFLVAFNLLPAFPMDGGRMLRALLASWLGHSRATEIAASVGQLMAIMFAVVGIMQGNWILLFIALFVYLGADSEARMSQIKRVLAGLPVRDAMITNFRSLQPSDTLAVAAVELLAGSQQDFPVVEHGQLVGILWRRDLFAGLQQGGGDRVVRDVMDRGCRPVSPQDPLDRVLEQLRETGCSAAPVLFQGALVGLLTNENIVELVTIRSALRKSTPTRKTRQGSTS